jgi:hypothetical protein
VCVALQRLQSLTSVTARAILWRVAASSEVPIAFIKSRDASRALGWWPSPDAYSAESELAFGGGERGPRGGGDASLSRRSHSRYLLTLLVRSAGAVSRRSGHKVVGQRLSSRV